MDQGEPGVDYVDANLNPLVCDICKKTFDSLDKLGESVSLLLNVLFDLIAICHQHQHQNYPIRHTIS